MGRPDAAERSIDIRHLARAGQELLDLIEDVVGIADERIRVLTRKLDVPDVRDVLSQEATMLDLVRAPLRCSTRVGTLILGRTFVTSVSANTRKPAPYARGAFRATQLGRITLASANPT